ncbi:MAG: helix-turn-helix transcriptional regulator [Proteobacteria bacterium]|nr:helix-turn-helix transcriptional regulator [Pseudomonadota bacterium]
MPNTQYRTETRLLSQRLREIREELGITQIDLSESIGQSQTFVSNLERGNRRIDVVELIDLCDALGIEFVPFLEEFEASVRAMRGERKRRKLKLPSNRARPRRRA